jgi:SAM-dependent methyltransferase
MSSESIRDEWTRLSVGWEEQRAYLLEASRPIHTWLVEKLGPKEGDAILEIGAGPGDTGFLAAPRLGASGRLVSSDISPAMVAVAERRAKELGVNNAAFEVVDAQAMKFPDASFDGVICRWGYMLMPDPAVALAETRRVLKPGGRLVLAVFTSPADNPWAALPSRLLVESGHVPTPTPGTPGILALADRARLEGLLRNAGFTDLLVEPVRFAWRFADASAYWTFLVELTALGPAVQRLTEGVRADLRRALDERLKTFQASGRLDIPARCWMVRAKP